MALDFGRCQTQVVKFAADDFNVFVFELPHITRAQKRVDHETYQAVHFKRHASVNRLDVKPRVRLVPCKLVLAQQFGLTKNGCVFRHRECTARLLCDFHFWKQRHLRDVPVLDQMAQYLAQLRDVPHDGGCRQRLV